MENAGANALPPDESHDEKKAKTEKTPRISQPVDYQAAPVYRESDHSSVSATSAAGQMQPGTIRSKWNEFKRSLGGRSDAREQPQLRMISEENDVAFIFPPGVSDPFDQVSAATVKIGDFTVPVREIRAAYFRPVRPGQVDLLITVGNERSSRQQYAGTFKADDPAFLKAEKIFQKLGYV